MIAIDTNIILFLLDPQANPPLDASTGLPVQYCQERIELLISTLSKSGEKLLLPTPVLAEMLVQCGISELQSLEFLRKHSVFRVAEFDQRAAFELSLMMRRHWNGSLKHLREENVSRHRIKFDLQIISIARVAGVQEILSDDNNFRKLAKFTSTPCRGIIDLPLPPEPNEPLLPNL